MMRVKSLFLLVLACVLAITTAYAQEAKKNGIDAQFSKTDFNKEPTFITSTSLSVQSDKRIFIYTGNVTVTQGDMTLTCNELEGSYDENNQIKQLVAKGNVIIIKGPTIKAMGQRGVYTASDATLVLTENPSIEQNGSTLAADVIRVFMNENRSVAEGDVRMKVINNAPIGTPLPAASPAPPTAIPGVVPLG